MPTVLTAFLYALAPTAVVPVAAVLIAWRRPGPALRGWLLHFTTGGLIAVVAVGLLGDMRQRSSSALVVGVVLGTAAMVGLEHASRRLERRGGPRSRGMLVVVGVDFAVDGLLLGVAVAHDTSLGVVLTVALALEDAVTALSVTAALTPSGGRRAVRLMSTVAVGLPAGAIIGGVLGGVLRGGPYTATLAFAAVALLFLALEELLREAHERAERPYAVGALFLGLLAFLMLQKVAG